VQQPPSWRSTPPLPASRLDRPTFDMPAGACDAHMHLFGPADRYPPSRAARYTLPAASGDDYAATAARLGLDRAVLVQPSFYEEDNRCLIDALRQSEKEWRGIVMAPLDTPLSTLSSWHEAGVRGLRLDLFKTRAAGLSGPATHELLAGAGRVAQRLGWSVDLYTPGSLCRDALPAIARMPCPVSIAHMGYVTRDDAQNEEGLERFVADLAASGNIWVKLTGPYRLEQGGTGHADRMAAALIDAMPDRLLWGTDWPHVMAPAQDSGALLNRLASWCPSADVRRRILVDNPCRLYGFASPE